MIEINIEADGLIKRIDDQINDMDVLASEQDDNSVAGEFVKWQSDDMNRKYPNLSRPDQYTSYTIIWPRSRLSGQRPTIRTIRGMRVAIRNPRPQNTVMRRSSRPILRPELFEKLRARMIELLQRVGRW
jgi:hypothetical protein